ncbi:MAG: carboxypeptidase regulatory-like domain-containing protein [Myxococcales bacterium]|nr:carboxypeptidase regulatory-like domain-containing protein [Myxococcales bacterium]MCB9531874.1 carboxypeptidase regulatory-like domain-containing protein [Myxococcales bacterium]
MRTHARLLLALGISIVALTGAVDAHAASIRGRVTALSGSGLGSMQVRLWYAGPPSKSLGIAATVSTAADGSFVFADPAPGRYLVDARMGATQTDAYGDRWFDVAEPVADGWLRESADVLEFDGSADIDAVDLLLLEQGVVTGRILGSDGTPSVNAVVRVERTAETNYNHTGSVAPDCCRPADGRGGRFTMRGLRVADDYRVFVHDTNGVHETAVFDGPWAAAIDVENDTGDLALAIGTPDPYEPNDSPGAEGASTIDAAALRAPDGGVFVSIDARIAPRNGDIDWYCFDGVANDRFFVYTTTALLLGGAYEDDPYVDPVVSVWTADRSRLVAESDDADGYGLNGQLDTGTLGSDGRYCVAVTTYGDTAWEGRNQGSAGRYTVIVELGNRAPTLDLLIAGGPAPEPPGRAIISEGAILDVEIATEDPDDDVLTLTYELVDADGNPVADGVLDDTPGDSHFRWTPSATAGEGAPYLLTVTAADDEFSASQAVAVDVRSVNVPPSTPVPVSPIDGVIVAETNPPLTVENASDPDGDILVYEFEIHYGDTADGADEHGELTEDSSGVTSYVPVTPLPEDEVIWWRVRARDGFAIPGISPWSTYASFGVNATNLPPSAPEIVKPDEGETVGATTPAISATNSEDPDGDDLSLVFEVATDAEFTDIVATSGEILQNEPAGRTTWAVAPPLEWTTTYYARAYAIDANGASSEMSNVRQFRVKTNTAPTAPGFGGEIGAQCAGFVFTNGTPTEVTITPGSDAERQAVTVEVEIRPFGSDPEQTEPLIAASVEQPADASTVSVPIDGSGLAEDQHYDVRVRATDGDQASPWVTCDFWINSENSAPGALSFVAPTDGQVFPDDTESVELVVSHVDDPDGAEDVDIAWCAAHAGQICPEDMSTWPRVPQGSGGETRWTYSDLQSGDVITVTAVARDAAGAFGPVAVVQFEVDDRVVTVTPTLCNCEVAPRPGQNSGWTLVFFGALFIARRRARRVS